MLDLAFSKLSTPKLLEELHERGKGLSATECKKALCAPPTIRQVMLAAIEGSSVDYKAFREAEFNQGRHPVLDQLAKEERVVQYHPYWNDLVNAIENVRPNQVIIVPKGVRRGGEHRQVLPVRSHKFMKKADTMRIRVDRQDIRDKKTATLDVHIKRGLKERKLGEWTAGYDWQPLASTNPVFPVIHLIDIVRGCIYDAALHNAPKVLTYEGADALESGVRGGIKNLPSFTEKDLVYPGVGFSGVPVYTDDKKEAASLGFDISQLVISPRNFWEQMKFSRKVINWYNTSRRTHEQPWDHHSILVYQRVAKKLEEKDWKVIKPYIETKADEMRFYWKTLHHCLKREWNPRKKEYRLNHLAVGDVEHLLWQRQGRQNMLPDADKEYE